LFNDGCFTRATENELAVTSAWTAQRYTTSPPTVVNFADYCWWHSLLLWLHFTIALLCQQ